MFMKDIRMLKKIKEYNFPGIGKLYFNMGKIELYMTLDGKAVFQLRNHECLVHFPNTGVTSYYEFKNAVMPDRIKAILMDLDGTTVKSEHFWIWVIEEIVRRFRNDFEFAFRDEDLPFISGYSVSEHINYAINKYCNHIDGASLESGQRLYYEIVNEKMSKVLDEGDENGVFSPAPYLWEFLTNVKKNNIKIAVVSSGIYQKACPELKSVFKVLKLGDPLNYYDAIVTGGYPIRKGYSGTLGEIEAKPHPWLYAEVLQALGVKEEEAVALEDSGAGILSSRSAGMASIGLEGGNIKQGGELPLCTEYFSTLGEVWNSIYDKF